MKKARGQPARLLSGFSLTPKSPFATLNIEIPSRSLGMTKDALCPLLLPVKSLPKNLWTPYKVSLGMTNLPLPRAQSLSAITTK